MNWPAPTSNNDNNGISSFCVPYFARSQKETHWAFSTILNWHNNNVRHVQQLTLQLLCSTRGIYLRFEWAIKNAAKITIIIIIICKCITTFTFLLLHHHHKIFYFSQEQLSIIPCCQVRSKNIQVERKAELNTAIITSGPPSSYSSSFCISISTSISTSLYRPIPNQMRHRLILCTYSL